MLLALRYYGRQMARLRHFTVPAMLLPALGNTCIFYIAPLIVAHLIGRFAGQGPTGIGAAMPYVLGFAGVLFFAENVKDGPAPGEQGRGWPACLTRRPPGST